MRLAHVTPRQVAGRDILLACPALCRLVSPIDCAAELVREMLAQAQSYPDCPDCSDCIDYIDCTDCLECIECTDGTDCPDWFDCTLVREMLAQAQAHLGCGSIERAVVTVPAYFDGAQRAATETACILAGLREVPSPARAPRTDCIDGHGSRLHGWPTRPTWLPT
eukprot:4407766-Prymnesium_polylepis.1